MKGSSLVRPIPPAWVLFGAGSALVAGAGTGAIPGVIGRLLAPLALVLLYRIDPRKALGAIVLGIAILMVATRSVGAVAGAALPVGLSGVILARGLYGRLPPGRVVLTASLPWLAVSIVLLVPILAMEDRAEAAAEVARSILVLYESMGADPGTLTLMQEAAAEAAEIALVVAPAWEFVILLGITLLVYRFTVPVLGRYGIEARPVPAFSTWRAPFGAVWVFAAGLAGTLSGLFPFREIGANLLVLGGTIYLVQGLAVLVWHFQKRRLPLVAKVLFFTAALFLVFPFFVALTVGAGLFDTWFDFRRFERPSPPPADD